MKTRLFKCIENFTSKNWKFSDKDSDNIFFISAENIDCGYLLEPPHLCFWAEMRRIVYTAVNPSFTGQNYIGTFSWCLSCFQAIAQV